MLVELPGVSVVETGVPGVIGVADDISDRRKL